MGNFSEQPAANLGTGTPESDPVAALFNASYVFGEPTYAIEQTPGPSDVGFSPPTTEPPIDVTSEPAPPPSTAERGGGAQWYLWPANKTSLTISLPNGGHVRSVWFPNIAYAVAISPSQAPGSIMYAVTSPGSELVAIPAQSKSVTLSVITSPVHPAMWVFATSDTFAPSRSSGGAQAYIATNITAGVTPCFGIGGVPATLLVGVVNNSGSAQAAGISIYDNALGDTSGNVVANIAPLGATQVITFPAPGIPLALGCAAAAGATLAATGVQVLTR